MSIRARIILSLLLIISLGFYYFIDWVLDDMKVHYREATEEPLVDTAYLLASFLAVQARPGRMPVEDLRTAFTKLNGETFSARIYDLIKTKVNLRVYVTDDRGIVIFDSNGAKEEGKDYSRWNDVYLALRGKYGARATRIDPADSTTSVFYVAAPIRVNGKIVGVVTVCKPKQNINRFIWLAKKKILVAGGLAAGAVLFLAVVVSMFITRPIKRLTNYAHSIRDGFQAKLPRLGKNEIGILGEAMEEMRGALEGKKFVEQYVQTLAHEIKSPLSAIQASAELLEEEMPPGQRVRFLANIQEETGRVRRIVERLLQLASLENRQGLREVESIELSRLVEEIIQSLQPLFASRGLTIFNDVKGPVTVPGERFLIRQAVSNLVQNSIDFTPPGGEIRVSLNQDPAFVEIVIEDTGPGVPDYALKQVFKKFYSLPRPDSGVKSSGLGLSLVREVALLHGGAVELENRAKGGVRVILRLSHLLPESLS